MQRIFQPAAANKRKEVSTEGDYLSQKRKEGYEDALKNNNQTALMRIFQLSDKVYSEALPQFKLQNTKVTIDCSERENYGDIASAIFFINAIKKRRPQCDVDLVLELKTLDKKTVSTVFPAALQVTYTSDDYYEREAALQKVIQDAACMIGVSVEIQSSVWRQTSHRAFWEYGYHWHPDTKDARLSMGLETSEEGIMIPDIKPTSLSTVQTPWVKEGLFGLTSPDLKIYHMHRRNWYMQMLSIYNVAALENANTDNFSVVLPLKHSLHEYIDWNMLDVAYLKEMGISTLSRVTPEGIETKVINANGGKEMRIVSGPIPKPEMEAIQQHAAAVFGCGGDNTISECIALDKIPYYDGTDQKSWFFDSMIKLATQLQLEKLVAVFAILADVIKGANAIYEKNTPEKPRGLGWFAVWEPSFDLKVPNSVPRLSALEISAKLKTASDQLTKLFLDPKLFDQAKKFNTFIKENLNVEKRMLEVVDRGLILGNFPELLEKEKQLWQKFKTGEIKLDEVFSELQDSLIHCAKEQARPATGPY